MYEEDLKNTPFTLQKDSVRRFLLHETVHFLGLNIFKVKFEMCVI